MGLSAGHQPSGLGLTGGWLGGAKHSPALCCKRYLQSVGQDPTDCRVLSFGGHMESSVRAFSHERMYRCAMRLDSIASRFVEVEPNADGEAMLHGKMR